MIGVYFQSWSSAWSSQRLDLEDCEGDVIYLAFVNPACSYTKGQFSLAGTGLDFSSDFSIVKKAIASLRSRGKKVMLSVGGATYQFQTVNVENLMALQQDLGCDGLDIDWEPTNYDSNAFSVLLKQFGEKKVGYLSAAVFSVGGYGEDQWKNAQPQGMYTGLNRKGLLEAGHYLDWINIMSYDASDVFNPTEAFQAYRSIFPKDIYLGFEVGPQAWGGALLTLDQVKLWGRFIQEQKGHFFIWSWQKVGDPDARQVIKTLQSMSGIDIPKPIDPPINPPKEPSPDPKEPQEPNPCYCTCHTQGQDWRPWTIYIKGQQVRFNTKIYTCRQSHTSQPDWTPPTTAALWQ